MAIRFLVLSLLFMLQGCAPGLLVFSVASISTTELTGKGITDHALSTAQGKDCRGARAFKNEEVCQDYPNEPPKPKAAVAVAEAPKPVAVTSVEKQEEVFALRRARSQ